MTARDGAPLFRRTPLLAYLGTLPGRCRVCGAHVPSQGHIRDCSFGFRARFAIGRDGKLHGTAERGPEGLS